MEDEPTNQPESRSRTNLTLALAVLPVPLYYLPVAGIPLALASAAAATFRLWRSTPWPRSEKRLATTLIFAPALILPLVWLLLGTITLTGSLIAAETALVPPVIGAARLALTAARLRRHHR
ncbi:hypothetical protein [Streptomyces sp. RFCAC02]|uniref:hypothetical protein n=1 Tax=Streptomyces sp. RFCAC02 TaxID=2499143 RepID=UPI0010222F32|nr:hypothetical protein [Streptomyces sp. RFCAC02]